MIFKEEEREKKPHWRQTILPPLTHIALTKKKDNTFNITTKEHFFVIRRCHKHRPCASAPASFSI